MAFSSTLFSLHTDRVDRYASGLLISRSGWREAVSELRTSRAGAGLSGRSWGRRRRGASRSSLRVPRIPSASSGSRTNGAMHETWRTAFLPCEFGGHRGPNAPPSCRSCSGSPSTILAVGAPRTSTLVGLGPRREATNFCLLNLIWKG